MPSPPRKAEGQPALITHLQDLVRRKDRGALAALRRGLAGAPGTVPEMFSHVEPVIPSNARPRYRQACYMVAALFGSYPDASPIPKNVGDTFRRIASNRDSESLEQRFIALLKCHYDDLFDHLRHAVALARSSDVGIDYAQLLKDITNWDHEGWVQRCWAQAYWSIEQDTDQGDGESIPANEGE